ncbi:MAG: hypothetical protein V1781_00465 [Bacteroidota bacterium]
MISVQGIYDGKKLRLLENIKVRTPKKVIITFLEKIEDELTSEELHYLADKGGGFDFLKTKEDDIYSDHDLKVKYK